jgi:hypothetical protein
MPFCGETQHWFEAHNSFRPARSPIQAVVGHAGVVAGTP